MGEEQILNSLTTMTPIFKEVLKIVMMTDVYLLLKQYHSSSIFSLKLFHLFIIYASFANSIILSIYFWNLFIFKSFKQKWKKLIISKAYKDGLADLTSLKFVNTGTRGCIWLEGKEIFIFSWKYYSISHSFLKWALESSFLEGSDI